MHAWHTFSRAVLRGASSEGMERGWRLFAPWPSTERWPDPIELGLDGLIYCGGRSAMPPPVVGEGFPLVVVGNPTPVGARTDVGWDNRAIGRLAAEHLLEQGHRSLEAWYMGEFDYQCERVEGFRESCEASGLRPVLTDVSQVSRDRRVAAMRFAPSPLGLFGAADYIGYDALRVAEIAGRSLPEELAVVGAGNDEDYCELTAPPLSSVDLPGEAAGRVGATVLADRLAGKGADREALLVSPTTIAVRHSSDMIVVEDLEVARALRTIRDRATSGLAPADLHRASSLARRTLEMRFRRVTGRTIRAEIARVQLQRAKELLTSTRLAVADVADRCGYGSPQQFSVAFTKQEGVSPVRYRSRHEAGGSDVDLA
ncbi:MAG: substrate-binding domain-containing protein [Planctomycetota bacterium]